MSGSSLNMSSHSLDAILFAKFMPFKAFVPIKRLSGVNGSSG